MWGYSKYIAFENTLAELAEKPRLIFVESGLDPNLFGGMDIVFTFDRETFDKKETRFRQIVHKFSECVRAYIEYKRQINRPTGRAGILIDTHQDDDHYSYRTLSDIQSALNAGGYTAEIIPPKVFVFRDFIRKISEVELLVAETRAPYISDQVLSVIQAKAIPCIRIAHLKKGETDSEQKLPDILRDYGVGDVEPIIYWKNKDDLVLKILLTLSKFQQTRTLLDTFDKGKKYFMSAGRKPAKIFISNPNSLNPLALDLVAGLQNVNIQFFQYQASMRIGTKWKDELERELQEFNIFIALINNDYHSSDWCQFEMRAAFQRWGQKEIQILPYIVEPTRLPELIKNDIQCSFVHTLSRKELVDQIVSTIDEYLIAQEQNPKGDSNENIRNEMFGKGNRWAVIVGVNEYEDRINYPPLQVCIKDALALRLQLIESGYDEKNIRILTDNVGDIPNHDNILIALTSLAESTKEDDLLLFYYSGHGIEKGGESYLVGRSGHHLIIEDSAIPVSKVKEIMRKSKARAKIIILDACHSGIDLGDGTSKGHSRMTEKFIQSVFEEAKGFAILASCEKDELSYEWRENERSVFTHYLLEALKGNADFDDKGFITIQDVNRFVVDGVKGWSRDNKRRQTPTLQYEVSGDIILVKLDQG